MNGRRLKSEANDSLRAWIARFGGETDIVIVVLVRGNMPDPFLLAAS
jgi:hypothetical protein